MGARAGDHLLFIGFLSLSLKNPCVEGCAVLLSQVSQSDKVKTENVSGGDWLGRKEAFRGRQRDSKISKPDSALSFAFLKTMCCMLSKVKFYNV